MPRDTRFLWMDNFKRACSLVLSIGVGLTSTRCQGYTTLIEDSTSSGHRGPVAGTVHAVRIQHILMGI